MIGLSHFLIVSAALFSLGIMAVFTRKNAVNVLMGVELILNSANLNLVAFSRFLRTQSRRPDICDFHHCGCGGRSRRRSRHRSVDVPDHQIRQPGPGGYAQGVVMNPQILWDLKKLYPELILTARYPLRCRRGSCIPAHPQECHISHRGVWLDFCFRGEHSVFSVNLPGSAFLWCAGDGSDGRLLQVLFDSDLFSGTPGSPESKEFSPQPPWASSIRCFCWR